ncbi:metacaspase-1 [uncultured Gammaproteobacteria bacterium]
MATPTPSGRNAPVRCRHANRSTRTGNSSGCGLIGLWLALLVVALWPGPAANAATGDLNNAGPLHLVEVPFNLPPSVSLSVSTNVTIITIGSTLEVCFEVSKPGFVSLWNIGTSGRAVRVFPNAYSNDQGPRWVEGGRRQCAGSANDPFRFEVGGPPGSEDLYLIWSSDQDAQPRPSSYSDASGLASALERLKRTAPERWGAVKTSYEIRAAGPPTPLIAPRPPPQSVSPPPPVTPPPLAQSATTPDTQSATTPDTQNGEIRILAMGSDVTPLTKSNQDAADFIRAMKKRYGVREQNIRFYKNVRRPEFKAGMDWLRDTTRPADTVVIFYSGHGAQVADHSGTSRDGSEEAFVPYEFNDERRAKDRDFVRNSDFVQWVNAIPTERVVAVVDACHSGGFFRSLGHTVLGARPKFYIPPADLASEPGEASPAAAAAASGNGGAGGASRGLGDSETNGIDKARPRAKGTLLAAARRDQYALELDDGSLFTMALVQAMDKAVQGSLGNAFTQAQGMVNRKSKNQQSPVLVGNKALTDDLTFRERR